MADKRRKRKSTTASYVDDTSKEYHAVDISDPQRRRRRSDCNSSSSTSSIGAAVVSRGESWMTKVTTAMSQRIFAGKKLGSSRSTQVMPLATTAPAAADHDDSPRQVDASSSSTSASAYREAHNSTVNMTHQSPPTTLRQVSSENSLVRAPVPTTSLAFQVSTPIEKLDFCPSVVCDIAADDSNDSNDSDTHDSARQQSVLQSTRVQSAQRSSHNGTRSSGTARAAVIEKVVPRKHAYDDDDNFEITLDSTAAGQRRRPTSVSVASRMAGLERDSSSSAQYEIDDDAQQQQPPSVSVHDTAPILKDFFCRAASTGQGVREQQRESRREALYRTSRERQERLRERVASERLDANTELQRLRVEQLQRINQQRRASVRREATAAHRHLAARLAHEQTQFAHERERWERDFEDEMELLSDAFRKATARTRRTAVAADGASVDDIVSAERPTTVAGLAVPEALAQLRRDATNYDKRLKTAAPRYASETSASSTCVSHSVTGTQAVDIFELDAPADTERDYETVHFDIEAANTDIVSNTTMHELLHERERLLQRLAVFEQRAATTHNDTAAAMRL